MTLEEMTNLIRFEAQIEGSDTMSGYINNLINSLLREYTGKGFYQELLLTDVALTNPGAAVQNWTLPTDIQHWLPDSVRFSEGGDFTVSRNLYAGPFGRVNEGEPYRFLRAGNILKTFPYASTGTSSLIWISYYKYPAALTLYTETFPIVALEDTVRMAAVARLSRYSKTDRSKAFGAEEQKAFTAANTQENRANSDA